MSTEDCRRVSPPGQTVLLPGLHSRAVGCLSGPGLPYRAPPTTRCPVRVWGHEAEATAPAGPRCLGGLRMSVSCLWRRPTACGLRGL